MKNLERRADRLPVRAAADDGFPVAFGRALDRRGESLESLRQRLAARGHPVSLASLSYWRSGQRRPERATSLEVLAEIEALLGVPAGDLVARLGPSRRRRPTDVPAPVQDVASERGSYAQLVLDELQAEHAADLAEESTQVVVKVDAAGVVRRLEVRSVWRALGDGAQHVPMVWFGDSDEVVLPRPGVTAGGRLGTVRSRPELGVSGCNVELDRPLVTGEEAVLELCYDLHDESHYYEHVPLRPIQEVLIWVHFDPAAVPERVDLYWESAEGAGSLAVDTDGVSTVHHRRRGFGPGHLGVRWQPLPVGTVGGRS